MSVADKLHQRQMALRKKSGLPHPDYYKELGHSYGISDDKERLAKQSEIKKKYKVEEVEQLDEMPESSMKTRDVHAHLRKSGWTLKRTGGGHDVYGHPKSKEHIAVPRHKQLKAPLIRGIMKASRVSEETEIDEQLEKKGRFVSGPVKKPYKSSTIVTPIKEAKDAREYDYEGDMAMSQIRSLMFNAQDMMDLMEENTNLPEWVQSKITLAEDYISTAANYLRGELNEEVKRYVPSPHGTPVPKKPKGEYERKVDKYLKKKYNKEEVELTEGRPSQRHPLEGHEYHKKTNAELEYIAKDAHKAAEAMKSHNTTAENKYRDQANDSATVRYFRQKSGMPDWYKKKYGHVKEETEQLDELSPALLDRAAKIATKKGKDARSKGHDEAGDEHLGQAVRLRSGYHSAVERDRKKASMASMSPVKQRKYTQSQKRAMGEDVEYFEEKNVPTSPEKWAQAKAQAKSKFDVYPSAYANGWASKKYKEMGGGWKSVSENTDDPSAAARTLSRKAQIVRDAAKGKKQEQEQASDKFQKDPELSSDIQKT